MKHPMRLIDSRRYGRQALLRAGGSGIVIALVTWIGYRLHFNAATVVLLYLLTITWQSLGGGFGLAAVISFFAAACLDFFFLPPILSLEVSDPFNVLALGAFLAISLVITRLVSRLRTEREIAERRGTNLEQVHIVTRQLLLAGPDDFDRASFLRILREGFGASAVCLFDIGTAEVHLDGRPHGALAERTKQAYLSEEDTDDPASSIFIRCLHNGNTITGAIGFEGLAEAEWIAGPVSALAAAAIEQARVFQRASHETAAAQAEVFRAAILDALGHEFKTPLATILAVVGGLRESQRLAPQEAEMAGMIESEVSRLNNLTSRLLRMARLDREEVKPRMRDTDVAALVGHVVRRYMIPFRERHVAVSYPDQPVEAQADRQLLDLALTQLLDNAFKYSVGGSAATVKIGMEDGFIAVRVGNEGSSIASDEQERIFDRFYRGSQVRKLISGAGLGLYVARKIAVAHGGSLELDKSALPGTVVFCLKLPLVHDGNNHVASKH